MSRNGEFEVQRLVSGLHLTDRKPGLGVRHGRDVVQRLRHVDYKRPREAGLRGCMRGGDGAKWALSAITGSRHGRSLKQDHLPEQIELRSTE